MKTDRELEQALENLADLVKPPGSVVEQVMQRLETESLPMDSPPMVRLVPDVPTDGADELAGAIHLKPEPPHRRRMRRRFMDMVRQKPVRWSAAAVLAASIVLLLAFWPAHNGGSPGGMAWAEVAKGFDKAENIHLVQTATKDGKETLRVEGWLRKPHAYRVDDPTRTVIDNGKKRLTIDRKARTAQFADSPLTHGGRDTDWVSDMVEAFRRGQFGSEVSMTQLPAESTKERLVYAVKAKESALVGKIWVHADSLLIDRMEGTDPTSGASISFKFDYEPIPDTVFALVIPAGFSELASVKRGALSGRVIDTAGKPVADATVYAGDEYMGFAAGTTTGAQGEFTIPLPPAGAPHHTLNFPVFLRAFHRDEPALVAWTLLRSPEDRTELAGTVPGIPGTVEVDRQGSPMCTSATGIVLKMEPAVQLTGRVTDAAGKPVSGASVRLEVGLRDKWGSNGSDPRLGGSNPQGEAILSTDQDGRYRFGSIPRLWKPCLYVLRAGAPGYASKDRCLEVGKSFSTDDIDFELYPAQISVTGKLVDNHGAPLAGRYIAAVVEGESVPGCIATSEKDGKFTLRNCPVAAGLEIEADLSHEPHLQKVPDPWYYLDVVQSVPVVADRTQYEITLTAQRPDVTLQIEVKNSAAEAVPYFPVEIRGDGMSTAWVWDKFHARTDRDGHCTLKNVPRAKNLHVRLCGDTQIHNEQLTDEVRRIVDSYKQRYDALIDLPMQLTPDKNTYTLSVTAMNWDEYRRTRR